MFPGERGRPVPEHDDEAAHPIWEQWGDGSDSFSMTQGPHRRNQNRSDFLRPNERLFHADLRKLPKKTFLGKTISFAAIEHGTDNIRVTHLKAKTTRSLKIGWARLQKQFRVDGEYVLSFDREPALAAESEGAEEFEEFLATSNGRLRLGPSYRSHSIAERLQRTVKEEGGNARINACLDEKHLDIIEETAIAKRNIKNGYPPPLDNEVLQNGFDLIEGELVQIVLPPKKLEALGLRTGTRSLFAAVVGLETRGRNNVWVEFFNNNTNRYALPL